MVFALGILALLLALLAIPVVIDFRVSGTPVEHNLRVLWAFGLVSVQFGDSSGATTQGTVQRDNAAAAESGSGQPLAAFRRRDFREVLLRFGRRLWQSVRTEDLRLRARLGLGDPAETGQLWALMGPLSGILLGLDDIDVWIEPDFADACLEFDGSGRVTAVPLHILGIAVALTLSPPFWRGLRAMRARP